MASKPGAFAFQRKLTDGANVRFCNGEKTTGGSEIDVLIKSWIERNKKKQRAVDKYAKKRAELKAKGDFVGLSMLPRNASPCRVVNRCEVTGRRHGYLRRFKMSRITFREMASHGYIPGVTKSSW